MARAQLKSKPTIVANNKEVAVPILNAPIPLAAPQPKEPTLDHILHTAIAKLTGNRSPASLDMARHDWWVHLASSPDKLFSLQKSLLDKASRLGWYGVRVTSGNAMQPLILPSPGDRRFTSDGWQKWPFNFLHQGFLLYEDWWREATTGVRGASPHHLDVVSFTARQMLDVFSPSNGLVQPPFSDPVLSLWDEEDQEVAGCSLSGA